ncbi:MAG TPA: Holliday junction branch migration protein RuvA [Chitinophagales bacterium]|jgi:Holliday junction DNA helicase RuvA|nr:Holliday junction branch migration protein RuvA [Chitinophagales bacterium]MBP6153612.1 Holliday junction branch migration protein RuvA [Chitinophagales bacterium]HQV77889.1 Holliday junction branch migration protein RuvA [Chitinophagales bacterium]HQW78610.1 Holliday junction branch migration protein RuvA [Chitinophagales bacterium]HRB66488.1 Holliday junction branch migration protein RuvA [Chitinophagales bacterium]
MFAYLYGKITLKTPTHIYLDCNGVAYFVHISLNTFSQLENMENATLFTHLVVREDAHILYGFYTEEEKNMFLYLISVSGVGPNTARLVLSSLSVQEFQKAIIQEDVRLIQSIKGIGPKSAQRLILELKDKLKKSNLTEGMDSTMLSTQTSVMSEEALSALNMLGFQKATAEKAVAKVMKENSQIQSVEELIKLSLKNL